MTTIAKDLIEQFDTYLKSRGLRMNALIAGGAAVLLLTNDSRRFTI